MEELPTPAIGGNLAKDAPLVHERLPRIVIIIDELADLMMTVGRDIEEYITRLGAKGPGRGHSFDPCHPASVGGCHHRTDQSQLSGANLISGHFANRFADDSRLHGRREACSATAICSFCRRDGAPDPHPWRLRVGSGSAQGDEVHQAAGPAAIPPRSS